MYSASDAFHYAVKNGAHQIALLIFDDAVFTNDDIDVSAGIELNDVFNAETDIAIGQALSAELTFNLFNDHGLLNEYEFGDFTATIGAQISSSNVTQNGIVQANSGNHTYVAYENAPYLKRDGVNVSSQPEAKVISILIYDGKVICRLANGIEKAYVDATGEVDNSVDLNEYMLYKMGQWEGKGISYANRILKIWEGTSLRTYEFVPLGKFNAERPNVPDVHEIHFTCYDLMQRFEKDVPSAADLNITYPISVGNFFAALCNYVNVPYSTTEFINSTAVITKELEDFQSVTMRDVIGWIAELAASNAKFDRDGNLCLDWLKGSSLEMDEHEYVEFNPYWYETQRISGVYNRASNGEYNKHAGVLGGVDYLIQDNPLLKEVE